MKSRNQINKEAIEIYFAIKQVINISGNDYCQSWWINTKNFGLKSNLKTSQIVQRAKLLASKGYLVIDKSNTSTSTGTCFRLTEKFDIGSICNSIVDLSKCKKGDILISSLGAKLEYIAPTPWRHYTYLDHVVRYVEDSDGKSFGNEIYGTRTNDGFAYAKNRIPETDHDIVMVM